jgi:hypothetical protein
VEAYKEFIVNGLFKAAEMDNEEIQETALQAISEIPSVGYQYIDSIINRIGSLTMTLLCTDHYSATRQAFNFWSELA